MAWAQEMKNLAADIKTSHRDRVAILSEIKDETKEIRKQGQQILRDADAFMKNVRAELTQAAKDLRNLLAGNEKTRKENFGALMRDIQATLKDIQGRVKAIRGEAKNFLRKAEEKRMADFNDMMKDIRGDLGAMRKSVTELLKSTKDLIGGYAAERKDAARYWDSIRGGGVTPTAASKKRGRPKGQEEEIKTPILTQEP